jgi:hypothetical protein
MIMGVMAGTTAYYRESRGWNMRRAYRYVGVWEERIVRREKKMGDNRTNERKRGETCRLIRIPNTKQGNEEDLPEPWHSIKRANVLTRWDRTIIVLVDRSVAGGEWE